jgi:alcohol dehydrogenase
MKAVVYHGPGSRSLRDVPEPELTDEGDAMVRVTATTICGTDLHILNGDVPTVRPGRILGHEAVGLIDEVRHGVHGIGPGDRVLVSSISSCGHCKYCHDGRYGQCTGGGGWILGRTFDGTQAEYVRVPFADNSTYRIPDGVPDEQALMLADVLPSGYEVGVLNGHVKPADVVAVIGAGPVGLASIMGARLFSPSHIVAIDRVDSRLAAARQFGADTTVNDTHDDPLAAVRAATDGDGADVTIEAVGSPDTFEMAVKLTRPGGRIANIGVHGGPSMLHLEDQWPRDLTVTTGLVDTSSIPALLRLVTNGQLDAGRLVSHRFTFDEFEHAYDVFAAPANTGALKVVLTSPDS